MKSDLLKETLLWIESIPSFDDEISSSHSSMYDGGGNEKENEVEQCYISKHFYFLRWLNIFRKSRLKNRRTIVDINFTRITQRIKLKYSFTRWRGIAKKEIDCLLTCLKCSPILKYRFIKRNCMLYWMMKSKTRRRIKSIFFQLWNSRFFQKKIVWKFCRVICHFKLVDAFKRWYRRSRWPLANLQRGLWQKRFAVWSIKRFQKSQVVERELTAIGSRHYFRAGLYEWLHRYSRVRSWETLDSNMNRIFCRRFVLQWICQFKDRKGFRLCESSCIRFHVRRRLQRYVRSWHQMQRLSSIRRAGAGKASSFLWCKSRFIAFKRNCDQRRLRRRSVTAAALRARKVLQRKALCVWSERIAGMELRAHVSNFAEKNLKRRVFQLLSKRRCLWMQMQNIVFYCRHSRSLRQFVYRIDVLVAMRASAARGTVRYEVKAVQHCLQQWRAMIEGKVARRRRFNYFRQLHPHPLLPFQLLRPGTVQTGVRALLERLFAAWKEIMPYFRHIKMAKRIIRLNRKHFLLDNAFDCWCYAFDSSMRQDRLTKIGFGRFRRRIVSLQQCRVRMMHSINSNANSIKALDRKEDSFLLVLHRVMMTESRRNISWALIGRLRCAWRMFITWRNFLQRLKWTSAKQMHAKGAALQELEKVNIIVRAVRLRSHRWILWRAMRTWFGILRSRLDKLNGLEVRFVGRKYFQHWLVRCERRVTARRLSRSDLAALSKPSTVRLSGIKQKADERRKQAVLAAPSTAPGRSLGDLSSSVDAGSKERSGFQQRIRQTTSGEEVSMSSGGLSSVDALSGRRGQVPTISICDDITSVDFNRRSYTGQYLWKKLHS